MLIINKVGTYLILDKLDELKVVGESIKKSVMIANIYCGFGEFFKTKLFLLLIFLRKKNF